MDSLAHSLLAFSTYGSELSDAVHDVGGLRALLNPGRILARTSVQSFENIFQQYREIGLKSQALGMLEPGVNINELNYNQVLLFVNSLAKVSSQVCAAKACLSTIMAVVIELI